MFILVRRRHHINLTLSLIHEPVLQTETIIALHVPFFIYNTEFTSRLSLNTGGRSLRKIIPKPQPAPSPVGKGILLRRPFQVVYSFNEISVNASHQLQVVQALWKRIPPYAGPSVFYFAVACFMHLRAPVLSPMAQPVPVFLPEFAIKLRGLTRSFVCVLHRL